MALWQTLFVTLSQRYGSDEFQRDLMAKAGHSVICSEVNPIQT